MKNVRWVDEIDRDKKRNAMLNQLRKNQDPIDSPPIDPYYLSRSSSDNRVFYHPPQWDMRRQSQPNDMRYFSPQRPTYQDPNVRFNRQQDENYPQYSSPYNTYYQNSHVRYPSAPRDRDQHWTPSHPYAPNNPCLLNSDPGYNIPLSPNSHRISNVGSLTSWGTSPPHSPQFIQDQPQQYHHYHHQNNHPSYPHQHIPEHHQPVYEMPVSPPTKMISKFLTHPLLISNGENPEILPPNKVEEVPKAKVVELNERIPNKIPQILNSPKTKEIPKNKIIEVKQNNDPQIINVQKKEPKTTIIESKTPTQNKLPQLLNELPDMQLSKIKTTAVPDKKPLNDPPAKSENPFPAYYDDHFRKSKQEPAKYEMIYPKPFSSKTPETDQISDTESILKKSSIQGVKEVPYVSDSPRTSIRPPKSASSILDRSNRDLAPNAHKYLDRNDDPRPLSAHDPRPHSANPIPISPRQVNISFPGFSTSSNQIFSESTQNKINSQNDGKGSHFITDDKTEYIPESEDSLELSFGRTRLVKELTKPSHFDNIKEIRTNLRSTSPPPKYNSPNALDRLERSSSSRLNSFIRPQTPPGSPNSKSKFLTQPQTPPGSPNSKSKFLTQPQSPTKNSFSQPSFSQPSVEKSKPVSRPNSIPDPNILHESLTSTKDISNIGSLRRIGSVLPANLGSLRKLNPSIKETTPLPPINPALRHAEEVQKTMPINPIPVYKPSVSPTLKYVTCDKLSILPPFPKHPLSENPLFARIYCLDTTQMSMPDKLIMEAFLSIALSQLEINLLSHLFLIYKEAQHYNTQPEKEYPSNPHHLSKKEFIRTIQNYCGLIKTSLFKTLTIDPYYLKELYTIEKGILETIMECIKEYKDYSGSILDYSDHCYRMSKQYHRSSVDLHSKVCKVVEENLD